MNRYAYRTSGLAIRAISRLGRARVRTHGEENIPKGAMIFVINHFTRIETLLMPYHIDRLTGIPVWSLADHSLFEGPLGRLLDHVGAVSTKNPHRDRLVVKSLLTGEACWIIFPEGMMVKSKKIFEKGKYLITHDAGKTPPHSGAAHLALRTEFYRRRLKSMHEKHPAEARRILDQFQIEDFRSVHTGNTWIIPVNVTYFPIRAKENALSRMALHLKNDLPPRMLEEIMTEGTMLLEGVDVDIRFGPPVDIRAYLDKPVIEADIHCRDSYGFDDPIACRPQLRKRALAIRDRYMAAIYDMTTVNHDHLFAAMLRCMPRKRVNEEDLRRRVYLAATGNLEHTGAFFHPNLLREQIHLITDDRHRCYRNFIRLAEEKQVVTRTSGWIEKGAAMQMAPLDFHNIRLKNPVGVIANEVEPLTWLQKRIRRLAWQPSFYIRWKISRYLFDQAILEFERDYRQFSIDGESKPMNVGMPIFIRGRRRIGILLIHGYMAAPAEVGELASWLGRMGYCVYAPRVRGHGTSPQDLAERKWQDWVTSTEKGYAALRTRCRDIVVGGFSNGAGLALALAHRFPDIRGVFAVCPAFRLKDFSSRFVPAVDTWNRLLEKARRKTGKMEFVENKPENPHINYFRNPISGIRELERLFQDLGPKLPDIHNPALVIQSDLDPVVDSRGSKKLFERLGSADKTHLVVHMARHGILLGPGADRVHRQISGFIDRLFEKK